MENAVLSFPTKKTVRDDTSAMLQGQSVEAYINDVMQEDLRLRDEDYVLEQELPPTSAELTSPSTGKMTHYTIYPLATWVDPEKLGDLQKNVNGEWLSCEDGLKHPRVSETAKHVFQSLLDREAEIDRLESERSKAETAEPGHVQPKEQAKRPELPRRLLRNVSERPIDGLPGPKVAG